MRLRYFLFGCASLLWGCNNIEDAKPAERDTFIHFYDATHNRSGVTAEITATGYVILANDSFPDGKQNIVVINTDMRGKRVSDEIIIPHGSARGLKTTPDGYYIIGDSIKTNLQSSDVADQVIYSARIFKTDQTGNVVNKIVMADRVHTSKITDIHGDAITLDANGNLIVLGSFKGAGATEKPFITSLSASTLDTLWSMQYNIIERDYVNSKSVHITSNGNVIWASDLTQSASAIRSSYLIIPYIQQNSTFENASQFGQTTDQTILVSDIQPAADAAFGYGVVGTYESTTGTNANIFFMRVDQFGNLISGSDRYFDGDALASNGKSVVATESNSEDNGDAIIATHDGGFIIGGSTKTSLNRGNGDDLLLIKVDGQGNVVWSKVFGGVGNETVSSIRETPDGGLLVCGSNNLNGLSSAFIMKTDKNGEVNN